MRHIKVRHLVITLLVTVMIIGNGVTHSKAAQVLGCIDFGGLLLNRVYTVGSAFVASGTGITVRSFVWRNGIPTNQGFAQVQNRGLAGGAGNEMAVNNASLAFSLRGRARALMLRFGEYGGNLNITINGRFVNFNNFADINGASIGGVNVSATNGFGNDRGRLVLTGPITSFSLGGQELWIDDVCII
jgi:hypothetical protein